MRLWAEERRQGTMELLLTMPITAWQAIVGKFLASWLFLIIALALTFPVVLTVSYLGNPDGGALFTGYLGSALAGRRLPRGHMLYLGAHAQPGHQFHSVRRDLLLPDPLRMGTGHGHAA